jgi:hypothetical protein
LQIHDGAIDSVARLHDHDAAAGEFVDVIRGAEQAGLAGEIVVDLALVPDVVAAGEDVEAVAEQLVGELRGDAEPAGGVFGVGDAEVDFFGLDDVFEVARDKAPPGGGEDVTYEKKVGQRNFC